MAIHIYALNIHELEDVDAEQFLPAARLAQMRRYRQKEDRLRCLAGGLLIRCVFGPEAAAAVQKGAWGKPYISGARFFNLSHSGDYVVLAAADHAVGVDIEKIAPVPFGARQCLTHRELAWVDSRENNERAFYLIWTGKESIMKACGLGFGLEPNSFGIIPLTRDAHVAAGSRWHLAWRMLDGHVLCTACEAREVVQLHVQDSSVLLGEV